MTILAALALLLCAFAVRDPVLWATLRYSVEGVALTLA